MSKSSFIDDIHGNNAKWKTEPIVFDNKQLAKDNDGNGTDVMRGLCLRDLPKGMFFKLCPTDGAAVFARGEFDRSENKYECERYDNGNCRYISGNKIVFVGFYF